MRFKGQRSLPWLYTKAMRKFNHCLALFNLETKLVWCIPHYILLQPFPCYKVKDLELLKVALKEALYGDDVPDLIEINVHYSPPKINAYISNECVNLYYRQG